MKPFRPFVVVALGLVVVTAHMQAAWPSEPIPLPRERPASKTAKPEQAARPLSLAPDAETATAANAPATSPAVQPPSSIKSLVAPRIVAPFATAASTATSPLDLSAVKQALDLVRKNRQDEATIAANSITDPVARKLVEWVILRSEDGSNDFSRYSAFINANPSWPSIPLLRRRAEAALWQERTDPQAVIAFFASDPPRSAKGHFALARALLTRGDVPRASAILHEAWRADAFSSDLEGQARETFGGLITPADDAARMDARLYAEDEDGSFARRASSRCRRNGCRKSAHCGDRSSRQCQDLARGGPGKCAARTGLLVQPHPVVAALRQDRRGRAIAAGGAA